MPTPGGSQSHAELRGFASSNRQCASTVWRCCPLLRLWWYAPAKTVPTALCGPPSGAESTGTCCSRATHELTCFSSRPLTVNGFSSAQFSLSLLHPMLIVHSMDRREERTKKEHGARCPFTLTYFTSEEYLRSVFLYPLPTVHAPSSGAKESAVEPVRPWYTHRNWTIHDVSKIRSRAPTHATQQAFSDQD